MTGSGFGPGTAFSPLGIFGREFKYATTATIATDSNIVHADAISQFVGT